MRAIFGGGSKSTKIWTAFDRGNYNEMVSLLANTSVNEYLQMKRDSLSLLHHAINDRVAVEKLSQIPIFRQIVNDDSNEK